MARGRDGARRRVVVEVLDRRPASPQWALAPGRRDRGADEIELTHGDVGIHVLEGATGFAYALDHHQDVDGADVPAHRPGLLRAHHERVEHTHELGVRGVDLVVGQPGVVETVEQGPIGFGAPDRLIDHREQRLPGVARRPAGPGPGSPSRACARPRSPRSAPPWRRSCETGFARPTPARWAISPTPTSRPRSQKISVAASSRRRRLRSASARRRRGSSSITRGFSPFSFIGAPMLRQTPSQDTAGAGTPPVWASSSSMSRRCERRSQKVSSTALRANMIGGGQEGDVIARHPSGNPRRPSRGAGWWSDWRPTRTGWPGPASRRPAGRY